MKGVLIIAEAGVNHNGSVDLAKKLIDVAVEAGADVVKFQTGKPENVMVRNAPKAPYQTVTCDPAESQFEMGKRIELDDAAHREIVAYCKSKNAKFLSTPFDFESIGFLHSLGVDTFKIPSGEITNFPYLMEIGRYCKKVILSTGMANLGEIENALNILITAGTPRENITLLHANTAYPTPMADVNLRAMQTIADAFKVAVGYSDHTLGIEAAIAAAALGATVIEKHFTLDRTMPGPDHQASLEPDELKAMIKAIRNIELALGDGIKKPSASEIPNMPIARKSLVAAVPIKKGEVFTIKNVTVKRPALGVNPMRWNEYIGRIASRDYAEDELLV